MGPSCLCLQISFSSDGGIKNSLLPAIRQDPNLDDIFYNHFLSLRLSIRPLYFRTHDESIRAFTRLAKNHIILNPAPAHSARRLGARRPRLRGGPDTGRDRDGRVHPVESGERREAVLVAYADTVIYAGRWRESRRAEGRKRVEGCLFREGRHGPIDQCVHVVVGMSRREGRIRRDSERLDNPTGHERDPLGVSAPVRRSPGFRLGRLVHRITLLEGWFLGVGEGPRIVPDRLEVGSVREG